MPGIAESITTTPGRSARKSATASSPLLASPTTARAGIVFEQPAEAAANERVIVDEEDGDGLGHAV